jgi:hypothetical protein
MPEPRADATGEATASGSSVVWTESDLGTSWCRRSRAPDLTQRLGRGRVQQPLTQRDRRTISSRAARRLPLAGGMNCRSEYGSIAHRVAGDCDEHPPGCCRVPPRHQGFKGIAAGHFMAEAGSRVT